MPKPLANGRYTLTRPLGRGGMAEVWLARDTMLDVDRAVKLLSSHLARNEGLRERFLDEARTMAKLRHPDIVTIFDVGLDGELPYLVMEVMEAGSAVDHLDDGGLAPNVAVRLAEAMLRALSHAHAAGVVHRDVKPHNLLLARDGAARLADFGIAQVDSRPGLTRTGAVLGTLAFMAPEQRTDAKSVDHRADLYSAGASLFTLLTGREPFDLYSPELRDRQLSQVAEPLAEVLRRACALEPAARFGSAATFLAALEPLRGEEGWAAFVERLAAWRPPEDAPAAGGTIDLDSLGSVSAPERTTETDLPTRTLLLHTGGTAWVDAIAVLGARGQDLLRWFPGSATVEPGLVAAGLESLSELSDTKVGQLLVGLETRDPSPSGGSGQLALATAVLWRLNADRLGMEAIAPGRGHEGPVHVLAASGTVGLRPGAGAAHYVVEPVGDWTQKLAALDRALSGTTVGGVDLVVPASQVDEVRALVEATPPRIEPVIHGVTDLAELAGVVAHVAAERGGAAALVQRRRALQEALREARVAGQPTQEFAAELARIEAELSALADLQPGAVLGGRFRLLSRAGSGGFSEVWRAWDERDERPVAVKALQRRWARDPGRVEVFYRGARRMGRLRHANVLGVVQDHGEHRGQPWVALEWCSGGTLWQAVVEGRRGGLSDLEIVLQAGDALEAAHVEGVVHGDVKPHNVMLDSKGQARLGDFDLGGLGAGAETSRTGAMGSFLYAAPEAWAAGKGSERADLFGLAMTTVFVLHGEQLPPDVLHRTLDFVEELEAPDAVKHALGTALRLEPERRQASLAAFLEELRQALAGRGRRRRFRGPSSQREHRARLRTALVGGVALGLLVGLAVVGRGWQAERRSAEAEHVLLEARARLVDAPEEAIALLRAVDALDPGVMPRADLIEAVDRGAAARVFPVASPVVKMLREPGSAVVAVGERDGEVSLWDASSGETLARFHWGPGRPDLMAWSDAGLVVASIRSAWNPDVPLPAKLFSRKGELLHTFQHGQQVTWIEAAGDELVTTAHPTGPARGWDLGSGALAWEVPGEFRRSARRGSEWVLISREEWLHVAPTTGQELRRAPQGTAGRAFWSGDGARLVTSDGTEIFLRTEEGEQLAAFPRRSSVTRALWLGGEVIVLDREGPTVVSAEGEILRRLPGADEALYGLAAHPSEPIVAAGGTGGVVHLWDLPSATELARLEHRAFLLDLAFTPAGELVAAGDFGVWVWPTTRRPSIPIGRHDVERIIEYSASSWGTHFLTWDGSLEAWDLRKRRPSPPLEDALVRPRHIRTTPGGEAVGAITLAGESTRVQVWDPGTGALRLDVAVERTVRKLAISEDLDVAITFGTSPNQLMGWRLDTGEPLELPVPKVGVRKVAYGAGGVAYIADTDGRVVAWDLLSGATRAVYDTESQVLGLNEARGALVVTEFGGGASSWDLKSQEALARRALHAVDITSTVLDAAGNRLVTCAEDEPTRVWDPRTLELVGQLPEAWEILISADGSFLVLATPQGRVRLYDLDTLELLGVAPTEFSGLLHMKLSPDGSQLWIAHEDGPIEGFELDHAALRADRLAGLGAATNLRVCRSSLEVVPVLPYPAPDTVWAPEALCVQDGDREPDDGE